MLPRAMVGGRADSKLARYSSMELKNTPAKTKPVKQDRLSVRSLWKGAFVIVDADS